MKIEIDCKCGHSTIFAIKNNIINEFVCESCKTHLAYLGPHYTMKFYDKNFPTENWRVFHEPIRRVPTPLFDRVSDSSTTWTTVSNMTWSNIGNTTVSWSEV